MARRTLLLFVALAVLHLAPIWSVRYLPLGDGPTHIYNAWVLHGLVTGDAPAHIAEAYRVDWKPHPNWSGHVLMAVAIVVAAVVLAPDRPQARDRALATTEPAYGEAR